MASSSQLMGPGKPWHPSPIDYQDLLRPPAIRLVVQEAVDRPGPSAEKAVRLEEKARTAFLHGIYSLAWQAVLRAPREPGVLMDGDAILVPDREFQLVAREEKLSARNVLLLSSASIGASTLDVCVLIPQTAVRTWWDVAPGTYDLKTGQWTASADAAVTLAEDAEIREMSPAAVAYYLR